MWTRGLPKALGASFERHAGGFPAVAACVFTPDDARWEAAGTAHLGPRTAESEGTPVPVDADTVFDLASLTKALATAPAVFALAEAGRLSLADPPVHALPFAQEPLRGHLATVGLSRLLNHSAGLPAYAPFFETCQTPEALVTSLGRQIPVAPSGARFLYSDLGYILLGHHLTRTLGEDWTAWTRRTLYRPLGLGFTFWGADDGIALACNREPGGAFGGLVHDENARILGPWCGHAGLFGSLVQVTGWLQALRATWAGRAGGPLGPESVRRMWTPLSPGDPFTPGFDRPARAGFTTAGETADREATVGHLGFSGTAFWLHPPSGRGGVLLTNRVALGRLAGMDQLRAFRAEFFSEVWRI
jgi:serine-type D-Ala-D-Ala carboxypeptidase